LEETQALKKRSEHALGEVRKEEQLPEGEDFSTPYGFEHVLSTYEGTETDTSLLAGIPKVDARPSPVLSVPRLYFSHSKG
jgi:hypothetical protein